VKRKIRKSTTDPSEPRAVVFWGSQNELGDLSEKVYLTQLQMMEIIEVPRITLWSWRQELGMPTHEFNRLTFYPLLGVLKWTDELRETNPNGDRNERMWRVGEKVSEKLSKYLRQPVHIGYDMFIAEREGICTIDEASHLVELPCWTLLMLAEQQHIDHYESDGKFYFYKDELKKSKYLHKFIETWKKEKELKT